MTLAFVNSPLDRSGHLRAHFEALDDLRRAPSSRVIRLQGDQLVFRNGRPHFENEAAIHPNIFLGLDAQGVAWFAERVENTTENDLQPLRGLANHELISAPEVSILAQARSILHWHERHGFCANCGTETMIMDAGYRRQCAACRVDHFPRTDPVIIIAVRHGNQLLLGRQSSWVAGMYSTLAGFMEPGETIEQAARREVFEESGIKVGAISYVTSQPWPFPSNLMIGLIGEALNDEIVVDTNELETAAWFSAEEARMMLARTHPQGLWATHPMAIAYHLIEAALVGI